MDAFPGIELFQFAFFFIPRPPPLEVSRIKITSLLPLPVANSYTPFSVPGPAGPSSEAGKREA